MADQGKHSDWMAGAMGVLIVLAVVMAAGVAWTADREVRRRRQRRWHREMARRLAAASARAEAAERSRQAALAASAELTSVMPGINRPRPTLSGVLAHAGGSRGGTDQAG
jgi:Flp pilus assembly protein TadB